MPKRESISKGRRFSIFARDSFTCRYCGRTSETVVLVIDHVVPVSKGGSNEDENLITSCVDCNAGKAAKLLGQEAPTETDRLRMAQERQEIIMAAQLANEAAQAHDEFRQSICNFWCEANDQEEMDRRTLSVMVSYAKQHGVPRVFEWIQMAADRIPHKSDTKKGMYISGIRRRMIEEGQL